MMEEEIVALCRAMGAGEGQDELLLPLVRAVRDRLAGRLREGVEPEDCGPAFPLAAAMAVTEHLAGMTGQREIASFTAGELTIRRAENGREEASLSRQVEGLLAPWLKDGGFFFQGVKG